MASVLTDAAKHVMLNQLATVAVFASMHTGDPGTSGANEASGGSPAYARKAITWNAAASGNLDNNANPVFDVPAGTYSYVGLWSAVSGGTYYGHFDIVDEVFAGQGTYTLSDADVALP